MNNGLFRLETFTAASGRELKWKIECDALSTEDWHVIGCMMAEMISKTIMEPFREVVGVPRGGEPLARTMQKHITRGARHILVVDDVWTTGGSITDFAGQVVREHQYEVPVIRAVVFARGPIPVYVPALFQMGSWAFDD